MAFNFPRNPLFGQIVEAGSFRFRYDGDKWATVVANPNFADIQGATGPEGPASVIPGPPGATGPQGPQGSPGPAASIGATGARGLDGQPGQDGATGPQGPAGQPGQDGVNGVNNGIQVPVIPPEIGDPFKLPLLAGAIGDGTLTQIAQTNSTLPSYTPATSELLAENIIGFFNLRSSQNALLARDFADLTQIELGRISTVDGFFREFELTSFATIVDILQLPIPSFSYLHIKVSANSDNHGEVYADFRVFNQFNSNNDIFILDAFGRSVQLNTITQIAPLDPNNNLAPIIGDYSIAVLRSDEGPEPSLRVVVYCGVEDTITGRANLQMEYHDRVVL